MATTTTTKVHELHDMINAALEAEAREDYRGASIAWDHATRMCRHQSRATRSACASDACPCGAGPEDQREIEYGRSDWHCRGWLQCDACGRCHSSWQIGDGGY